LSKNHKTRYWASRFHFAASGPNSPQKNSIRLPAVGRPWRIGFCFAPPISNSCNQKQVILALKRIQDQSDWHEFPDMDAFHYLKEEGNSTKRKFARGDKDLKQFV
jgi:hypothetical protein